MKIARHLSPDKEECEGGTLEGTHAFNSRRRSASAKPDSSRVTSQCVEADAACALDFTRVIVDEHNLLGWRANASHPPR